MVLSAHCVIPCNETHIVLKGILEHISYFLSASSYNELLSAQRNMAAVSQQNELQLERHSDQQGLSGILENLFLLFII